MNKQVLPTLYSQIRGKKTLNKCALSPCSWTILIRLELGQGCGESSAELWQNLMFYRIALERKPKIPTLIWEWVVEPGNPVRKEGWGKKRCPMSQFVIIFFLCLAGSGKKIGKGKKVKILNRQEQWDSCCPTRTQKQVLSSTEIGPISSISFAPWESLENPPE